MNNNNKLNLQIIKKNKMYIYLNKNKLFKKYN